LGSQEATRDIIVRKLLTRRRTAATCQRPTTNFPQRSAKVVGENSFCSLICQSKVEISELRLSID